MGVDNTIEHRRIADFSCIRFSQRQVSSEYIKHPRRRFQSSPLGDVTACRNSLYNAHHQPSKIDWCFSCRPQMPLLEGLTHGRSAVCNVQFESHPTRRGGAYSGRFPCVRGTVVRRDALRLRVAIRWRTNGVCFVESTVKRSCGVSINRSRSVAGRSIRSVTAILRIRTTNEVNDDNPPAAAVREKTRRIYWRQASAPGDDSSVLQMRHCPRISQAVQRPDLVGTRRRSFGQGQQRRFTLWSRRTGGSTSRDFRRRRLFRSNRPWFGNSCPSFVMAPQTFNISVTCTRALFGV